MVAFSKAEMSGTAVKADSPDDAIFFQPGDEAIYRCRIAGYREVGILCDLLKCYWLLGRCENFKACAQGTCFPHSCFGAF